LSKTDAESALRIYRTFVKQTEAVVQYLSIARLHEHSTRLEIPKIKHAPITLAASLEEYLNDKDFDVNRRQYLAEREAKKTGGKSTNGTNKLFSDSKPAASKATTTTSQPTFEPVKPAINAPLIDFFEAIEDNQQTMAQPQFQQYPQQTGYQQPNSQMPQQVAAVGFPQQQQQPFSPASAQGTNPFAQMQSQAQLQQPQLQPQMQPQIQPQIQTQFTGAGFGGYTPQPFSPQNPSLGSIPQNGVPNYSNQPVQPYPPMADPLQAQQTSTNPFRQSAMPTGAAMGVAEPKLLNNPTGVTSPLGRSPTNPFAKHTTGFQQQTQSPVGMSSFSPLPSIQEPQTSSPFAPQPQQQAQPLQPTPTGTNPFARNPSPIQGTSSPQGGLSVQATGSTNPFRQSAFVNQQTGQGWQQTAHQGTLGGMPFEQVPTTSVFPRPGQPQQTGQYLG
jgi:phosphatidylinositol-binding clathrin assembly protein